jgi:hypothetical protein
MRSGPQYNALRFSPTIELGDNIPTIEPPQFTRNNPSRHTAILKIPAVRWQVKKNLMGSPNEVTDSLLLFW